MKGVKNQPFFLYLSVLFGLLWPVVTFSETSQKNNENENAEARPILIKSQRLEMNNMLKVVTFTGDVKANYDNFIIDCDKMIAYYVNMPDQQEKEKETLNIDKIVAMGNVIINRAEGGVATAEEATYYQEDERIILTGNPTVKQGNDVVKGERITIFLKEDRSVVEGSEEQKVTVTISPRPKKGK